MMTLLKSLVQRLDLTMRTFATVHTCLLRGFAKLNKFHRNEITMEVGGWVQVLLIFFLTLQSS